MSGVYYASYLYFNFDGGLWAFLWALGQGDGGEVVGLMAHSHRHRSNRGLIINLSKIDEYCLSPVAPLRNKRKRKFGKEKARIAGE